MRTTVAVGLSLVLLLLAGCGDPEAGTTPKETWETWHAAQIDFDWEGLYGLLSPKKCAEAERAWEEGGEFRREAPEIAKDLGLSEDEVKGMSVKDLYVAMNEKMVEDQKKENAAEFEKDLENFRNAEHVEDEIDGDKAKVRFTIGDRKRTLRMVKEDGKWYIDRSPL